MILSVAGIVYEMFIISTDKTLAKSYKMVYNTKTTIYYNKSILLYHKKIWLSSSFLILGINVKGGLIM